MPIYWAIQFKCRFVTPDDFMWKFIAFAHLDRYHSQNLTLRSGSSSLRAWTSAGIKLFHWERFKIRWTLDLGIPISCEIWRTDFLGEFWTLSITSWVSCWACWWLVLSRMALSHTHFMLLKLSYVAWNSDTWWRIFMKLPCEASLYFSFIFTFSECSQN